MTAAPKSPLAPREDRNFRGAKVHSDAAPTNADDLPKTVKFNTYGLRRCRKERTQGGLLRPAFDLKWNVGLGRRGPSAGARETVRNRLSPFNDAGDALLRRSNTRYTLAGIPAMMDKDWRTPPMWT